MKLINSLILILAVSISVFAQSNKFKPEKGMKQIIPFKASMKVEVGKTIYYSAKVHGSVGIQASCYSEFDTILNLKESHFAYNDLKKSEMPGGDAATKTFVFEAVNAGECRIMIKEHFRGELREEFIIEFTVKEKIVKKAKNNGDQKLKANHDGEEALKVDNDTIINDNDTIQLIPFKGNETIVLGQKIMYTANVHGSVGIGANVWAEGNEVLKLIDTQFEYEQEQEPGMTGGDGAFETFVFEGTKEGECTIIIQEIFRGEVKNEFTIVVTVVAKK